MSRRVPSTGVSRTVNRAPSLAPSSRVSRPPSSATASRRTTSALAGMRVPSDIPESNINVVVRCRGRTPQEIEENSPPITQTDGPVSDAITVTTTPAASATSIVVPTDANTKTYKFDKVFGPEADQTTVFSEVADGMLNEVLSGYNCTIFAYGQTGTGKTYTMQGDMTPTPLQAPSIEAGIIPRVLHRLFALLEAQENNEYAVKCSYLEIYNEELRDLLSYDYGKPGATSNIKIFDDTSKKGVNVQGVEEAGLRDLNDGLAVLRKGSQRRQVAETKLNTESSRSHSIFTLTVHVKEMSGDKTGEDMLRIGKFNLVDLAGSEAVGRSMAQGAQRREAGMINQSLLSLGRVINALVDKSAQHVPYRESKLTRLLQDSLGGRTKTCIIATVSPTKSNMEETLSTLEYASRAKSIRNKPEVNAHLTKAGLLREYLGDIERLKAELHAAREKNGVYIPDEQWKEMSEERVQRKLDYDEAKTRVTTVEVELRTRRAEFEQLTTRFVTTSSELTEAREAERQLGAELLAAKADLEATRAALGHEKAIADAYAAGEERLDGVAGKLHAVASTSIRDAGGLFDKLGRVNNVLDANSASSHRYSAAVSSLSQDLQTRMSKLHNVQGEFGGSLRAHLEAYAARGKTESESHMASLDASLGALNALAATFTHSVAEDKTAFAEAGAAILAVRDEVQGAAKGWARAMDSRSSRMVEELVAHQRAHLSTVQGVLDTTSQLVDAVIAAAQDHVAAQDAQAQRVAALASQAAADEIGRLRAQNRHLAQVLVEERKHGAQARTDLLSGIAGLVERFSEHQDARFGSALASVRSANDTSVDRMEAFAASHAEAIGSMAENARTFRTGLDARAGEAEAQRGAGPAAVEEVSIGLQKRLEAYGADTSREGAERVGEFNALCGRLGSGIADFSNKASKSADAHLAALADVATAARGLHDSSARFTRAVAQDSADLTTTLLRSHTDAAAQSSRAHSSAKRKLDAMLSATSEYVGGLAADEPTGETPRKRAYHLPSWERTAPRGVLLERIRRGSPLVLPRAETPDVDAPVASPDVSASTSTISASASVEAVITPPPVPSRIPSRNNSVSSSQEAERPVERVERPTLERSASDLVHISSRRRPKKLGSVDIDSLTASTVGVLKEGGNIPRRRR
ncbi:kinesin-domain-containing protein [Cutaneotrichosporon oleaginosum]|uniref:Kinesin-domain-containing protein n=1 Tax=Cutaneotrichosporon oleaginosum TaxID=879819 RepID=A0A0J0XWB7_9TREE|nr:kinesin-domain-containing protein [Cutaneotrichosporon oleaginosum]KLT45376.1 kinesin-domain-containing protein [Cutaneotrichosporon oleaginosum]TXT14801.1 hypothetical protein COLE_00994 [Cutaneotrichosporon oleaginosum]